MTLLSTGTDYEQLAAAFRPIFSRIAQGAANREQHRILPDEQIRWLKEAGLKTSAPIALPPESEGLTVTIWIAEREATAQRSVA